MWANMMKNYAGYGFIIAQTCEIRFARSDSLTRIVRGAPELRTFLVRFCGKAAKPNQKEESSTLRQAKEL
jgi:hypothetical protein